MSAERPEPCTTAKQAASAAGHGEAEGGRWDGGVLFPPGAEPDLAAVGQPDIFVDLGLDQIVASVAAGREEYDLQPFFWRPLASLDAVRYRQAVVRDLGQPSLVAALDAFAEAMRAVRADLARAEKHSHPYQAWRWRLDAANRYWAGADALKEALDAADLSSDALRAFRSHLAAHLAAEGSQRRKAEGAGLAAALAAIRYELAIQGLRVQVRKPTGGPDYGRDIEDTFAAFTTADDPPFDFLVETSLHVNRVEGEILTRVGAVEGEVFRRLEAYAAGEPDFIDAGVRRFDREIQFYLAFLEHVRRLEQAGLGFCLPVVAEGSVRLRAQQAFDLALAAKLAARNSVPVRNDVELRGPERMIVVTGPNQGGKTTYARLVGQLCYLASLGLPAPAGRAQLALPDRIFTHFERAERMVSLRGKLQDDLVRIHAILEAATPRSLIVINEIFASTTLRDAVWLSERVAGRILELGAACVWVTFIDEVAGLGEAVVSMMSTVAPDDPAVRTFEILRRPPSGLAFALSVAERHRLTYGPLRKRLQA